MGRIDSVAAAAEEKQEQEKNNDTVITLQTVTTITTDPWMLFLYALKAPTVLCCRVHKALYPTLTYLLCGYE